MPSPEKERAADESENNAKQASGIWVRFVGTPDSGSFGRNQTPPQSLPKWVCFFESPTQRDAMTEHPYQTHVAGIAVPMDCGFLVIGAAVAGLRAAIELAKSGTVLVIAKDSLRESSSEYAQGGIAVALSDDDEVALHEQDTLYAGDGLCDQNALHILVEEGPAAIQDLIDWGAEFDREGNKLSFTREGAHSRNRILHAH